MRINKYKILFKVIYLIVLSIFIFFICCCIFLANGFIEKGPVKNIIETFKSRSEYSETISIHGQKVNIYTIKAKYGYETTNYQRVFDYKENYYIGSKTDVIITNRNPLRLTDAAIIRDFGEFFSTNFFIGHATINITDDGSRYIESVGNDSGFYGVRESENTWIDTEVRYGNDAQMILGLRIKNLTSNQKNRICNDLKEKIGCAYNMNFLIQKKNKYYCTDLITRVFNKNSIQLDYDWLYPTGNDLIISDNTFIIFICERLVEGEFNIYYLSKE